jgi:two-component system phosphate regulon response regulator PhoB
VSENRGAPIKTVLVVDDDRPLRTLCRASLEEAGFRVIEAADGEQALASVHDEQPDLILLDIMMPGISGWEVTSALLADRATDRIPIVFMSARTELADRVRAFGLGAQDYVTKPFDPRGLAETVAKTLDEIDRGDRDAALAETLAALRKEQITVGKPPTS